MYYIYDFGAFTTLRKLVDNQLIKKQAEHKMKDLLTESKIEFSLIKILKKSMTTI